MSALDARRAALQARLGANYDAVVQIGHDLQGQWHLHIIQAGATALFVSCGSLEEAAQHLLNWTQGVIIA